jgi:hypothetical protein
MRHMDDFVEFRRNVLEDFPTVCTDPPRATRRVKRTLAYNTEYLY